MIATGTLSLVIDAGQERMGDKLLSKEVQEKLEYFSRIQNSKDAGGSQMDSPPLSRMNTQRHRR